MNRIDKTVITLAAIIALTAGAAAIYLKPARAAETPAASSSAPDGAPGEAEQPLTEAPDITVADADGNETSLSSLRGRPVVLNFWATWCGYCVMEMPDFDEVYAEYADRVDFMMINAGGPGETLEKAQAFVEEKGYSFPVYYDADGAAATAYQATGLPTTVVVDERGFFYGYAPGMISGDVLREALDGALALYE